MDPLTVHARDKPGAAALVEGDRTLSWAELVDRRDRLADALLTLGLGPGDHVALYAHNSIEWLLAAAAARALGVVAVPLNHRLTPEEVAYILDDSDAVAVFAEPAFLPVVEPLRRAVDRVRHWILLGGDPRPWAHHLDHLLATGRPVAPPEVSADLAGGSMIYTAGTTGKPKGAFRRSPGTESRLRFMRALDLADPGHVHLAAGPLYHSAPLTFATFSQILGSPVVVMPRFDPEAALATIARHRCTSTFMAPTLIQRIVDLPASVRQRHDVSSLRVLVMAAAPCPMRVKEAAIDYFGPVLYEFYGSTELSLNTILRPEDVLRKPGSCGRAAPGIELAILDDDGRPLPPGQPGELHVRRNPGVFDGYYKRPEATRQMARGDWLSVGDVAFVDAEGFVYICDRKRDMLISGGVNVYPAEIEDVLHRHPAVEDVAVFGVPDPDWGERVHAAVQARPGHDLTAETVLAHARRHLAGYKVPREVSFHAALPRDSAGKLVKRLLRDPYWAGHPRRV